VYVSHAIRTWTLRTVVNDTSVVLLVRAREADSSRSLVCRASNDVDLSALLQVVVSPIFTQPMLRHTCVERITYHVELRSHAAARRVQRNKLAPEQVLSRSNALGDGNGLHALVGDEAVHAPLGAIECILLDLLRYIVSQVSANSDTFILP
jgi:hypothetical protein